jgi:hypothetical protein
MVKALCEDCLRRPMGLEGHDGLDLATTVKKKGPLFRCVRCNMAWIRSYEGAGIFVWMDYGSVEGNGEVNG